jgi:hypothetical protein
MKGQGRFKFQGSKFQVLDGKKLLDGSTFQVPVTTMQNLCVGGTSW